MKFIKTAAGIYLNVATVENFQVEGGTVVAWTIGDPESPYTIKECTTAEEAEYYLDTLISALGIVVNADD